MKKGLALVITTFLSASLFGDRLEELEKKLQQQMKIIQQLQQQITQLKKEQELTKKRLAKKETPKPTKTTNGKEIENLKKRVVSLESFRDKAKTIVSNDHLFWSYDLRSAYDYIYYISKNSPHHRYINNIFTNRVRLTGVAKPADNLKANLQLEATNIYGMNSEAQYSPFQNNSWIAAESPDDTVLRVKQAYFNYWFGPNNGLMFSAGRRPATAGYPSSLWYGDNPNSPLSHLINMEFDGLSFQIGNDALSALSDKFADWGTWFKICAGRGYSSSVGAIPTTTVGAANKRQIPAPPYTKDNLNISDFAGIIIVPYDDGTYALWTETVYAGQVKGSVRGKQGLQDLGDVFGFNGVFKVTGISSLFGVEDSDFLDDTNMYLSFAATRTIPKPDKTMLGSPDAKWGHSWWFGMDMPGVGDGDRMGFSLIRGSKYFRPFTYGEDTLIGSFAATRGTGLDLYYITQIIPHLQAGFRGTLLNYNYSGSNAFFGDNGDPDQPDYIKKATDLKVYIRYSY